MAWYSNLLAVAIPPDLWEPTLEPFKSVQTIEEPKHFVYSQSRRGALLRDLAQICEISTTGQNIYLLHDARLNPGADVMRCIEQLDALIGEIAANPSLVLEATRKEYSATTTLHAKGFQPLEAQLIHSNEAYVRDGWVYSYTEKEVHELMTRSFASNMPCTSDDGDTLGDVFNFLKSHLALLKFAAQCGHAIAYAEVNV